MEYSVSAVKCDSYNLPGLITKIEEAVTYLGGLKKFIRKDDRVLLKPNLLSPKKPEAACTTHPLFLKAIIRILKKIGARPFVGDSPAFHTLGNVVSVSGIKQICSEEEVPIINFKTPIEIKNPDGRLVKSFIVSKEIFDFDKIINIPKLKNHSLTLITVAVKNLFGVIPGPRKSQYHLKFQDPYRFSQMLVDLNMVIKPVLTIVDGIVGMQGDGPAAGEPKKCSVIVAGNDTVSVDYVSSIIMNYDPEEIPVIKAAQEAGFGGFDSHLIDLKGDDIKSLIVKDFKTLRPAGPEGIFRIVLRNIAKNFLVKKPVINRMDCTGCGECAEVCPTKTIKLIEKKAYIDYKNCIRCYCCFEVCRANAIKLKRF